jgi:hypothetical protein
MSAIHMLNTIEIEKEKLLKTIRNSIIENDYSKLFQVLNFRTFFILRFFEISNIKKTAKLINKIILCIRDNIPITNKQDVNKIKKYFNKYYVSENFFVNIYAKSWGVHK